MTIEPEMQKDLEHVLDRTRGVWDDLRGQRIFLTGATGFIGCWLLETFIEANRRLHLKAEAVALTRDPVAFRKKVPHLAGDPCLRLVQGDVRTYVLPAGTFSHVIHGAAQASRRLNDERPFEMIETIVEGTTRTLEFCRDRGANRMLFLSSGAVYGAQPPELARIPEDYRGAPQPNDPKAAYAEAKRLAEVLCFTAGRMGGPRVAIARCFAFVGPYLPLDIHYAIGNFIRDGLGGGPIVVASDGSTIRSYLYAADLAIWLWTILFRGEPNRPYNVGSDEPISVGELAHRVSREFSPVPEVVIRGKVVPGAIVDRYVPAIDRARKELGLEQTYDVSTAIRRTIEWNRHSVPRVEAVL